MKKQRPALLLILALAGCTARVEAPPAAREGGTLEDKIKKLTPMQHKVTKLCGTEPPFDNEYWNNKRAGLYVDVVTGDVLFSSLEKFDSGSGWPSFTAPVNPGIIEEKKDATLGMARIEVRSKASDSHLGHVFPDGPGPKGLRYCINSAALRFVPLEDLEKESYAEYLSLFSSPGKK